MKKSINQLIKNKRPYQISQWNWKVWVNVVTPLELKMVCRESNEINCEKNCFVFNCSEKKNCLLLIRSEKV